jgi:hypothetical protein
MDLFTIENNIVRPTPHALLLSPFKELWERDTSSKKERAIQDFSYIEFVCSMRKSNPFSGYTDDVKASQVAKIIYKDEYYKPDELQEECIEFYIKLRDESSPTINFYKKALTGAEKLSNFFETVDFSLMNDRGIPIYKPGDLARSLKDAPDILASMHKMKEKVDQELFDSTKNRGDREINHFEM